jgi:spore coat polysaccharide biosynthesis predicted glycosyltransferase SpsG
MTQVCFCVDANFKNRSYRLRRSIALALGLKESDPSIEITFYGSSNIKGEVLKNNLLFHDSSSGFDNDLESLGTFLTERHFDILIMDLADTNENHLSGLSKKIPFLVIFDDFGIPIPCSANILANPNIYGHLINYPPSDNTELLIGTEFCPLPPEFDNYADFERITSDVVKHVLVDLEDDGALTLGVIQVIKELKSNFSVTVITNPNFKKGEELARLVGLDSRFLIVTDQNSLKRFSLADVAITSPNLSNEVFFFRLPSVMIGSKSISLDYIGRNELAVTIVGSPPAEEIRSALFPLFDNPALRDTISKRLYELIDNLGRFRLADKILESYKTKTL